MPTPRVNFSVERMELDARCRAVTAAMDRLLADFDTEDPRVIVLIGELLDRFAQVRQIVGRRNTSLLRRFGNWGQRGYRRER
ncbi:MAG: hypothetical protein HY816_20155 [Candidatus Wallbacteria bacterium]|nr:hypothetical protein [Candidatus Wallbacteria bacterium]